MLTVIALNIFSFITLKNDMDQIADELIVVATHKGEYDVDFNVRAAELMEDYFEFDLYVDAEEFYKGTDKVQLGDKMWVDVYVDTTVKGLGIFEIPIRLHVKRSGISEVYWKW